MKMTRALFQKMVGLMGAAVNALVTPPDDVLIVKTINQPFAFRPDMVYADLSFEEASWSSPYFIIDADQSLVMKDPVTGDWLAGFQSTNDAPVYVVSASTPNFTIYGFALIRYSDSKLLAVETLPTPIHFNGPLQALDLTPMRIHCPESMNI